jgi:hypothetical protein
MGRLTKNVAVDSNRVDSVGLPYGTTASTPANPTSGQVRYNTDLKHIEVFNGFVWDTIDGSTKFIVQQHNHGLIVFDGVAFDGTNWVPAIATSVLTSGIGVISRVINADTFEVQQTGMLLGQSGLIAGDYYYLSANVPGLLTNIEPGVISNPLFFATSGTSGMVLPYRATVGTPASGESYTQLFNSTIWVMNHNRNTTKVMSQLFDSDNNQIIPDTLTITNPNTVIAVFGSVQNGVAHLIFF